jgi:2'-5' RNA ligase
MSKLQDWQGERRLFLGVVPDALQSRQLSELLPLILAPAKAVAVDNLHLTLLFLGQSTASQAQSLVGALTQVQLPTFSVQLQQWQLWSGPAVLCLAGRVEDPALAMLYQQLLQCAALSGFAPPHHPLTPHITLARHAKQLPLLPPLFIHLKPSTLVLFHSDSTPSGVCYRPLWQRILG